MRLNSWRTAVSGILKAGNVRAVRLAEALGVSEAAVHYYLHGKRTPDSETVRRINQEVAALVDMPEAREYLFALSLRDGLLAVQGGDVPFEALLQLLDSLDPYFVGTAAGAVARAIKTAGLADSAIHALFIHLAAVRGKNVLSRLHGATPKTLSIDELLLVFRAYGAPLEPYLRSDEEARIRRARDFFALVVEAVVTSYFAEVPAERRQGVLGAILEQFDESADEIADAVRGTAASAESRIKRPKRKTHTIPQRRKR